MGIRKGQNTWYKHNSTFIREGVAMIFRRNYGHRIDPHEVDSKLSIGENIHHLLEKFKLFFRKW